MTRGPVFVARVLALAVLVAAVASVSPGCGDPEDAGDAGVAAQVGVYDADGRLLSGRRRTTASPNVILIVLDTTRYDAILERNGRPPDLANVRRFVDGATWFVDASANAPWTAPSVTSILTGLYPWRHGVQTLRKTTPLAPAVATLAEYLGAIGYETAALTGGGWVSSGLGLGQGIDVRNFRESFTFRDSRASMEKWAAARRRDRPFFLFLHTYEAHDPYGVKFPAGEPPPPADRMEAASAEVADLVSAADPDPRVPLPDRGFEFFLRLRTDPVLRHMIGRHVGSDRMIDTIRNYDVVYLQRKDLAPRMFSTLEAAYRDGLRTMDAGFEAFLPRLDRAGLLEHAIVVLATDHGEAFGEHENLGHMRWLYDELTRAVLAIRAPGRLPAGKRIGGSCSLTDVVPTVLDLCGLPPPDGLDGRSLLPLAAGTDRGRVVEAEDLEAKVPGPSMPFRVHSVRDERAKWIGRLFPDGALPEEVFDLATDPAEKTPLGPEAVARFGPEFQAAVDGARRRLQSLVRRRK